MNWTLALSAMPVLLMSALMTWLSREFVYGEAHAQRPIGTFVGLWILGWAGYLTACFHVAGKTRSSKGAGLILVIGLLARLFLWPSLLIQENDPYRYLTDGMCLTHGVNPFTVTPLELQHVAAGGNGLPLPEAFKAALRTAQAEEALARVSYPELRTIYPPVAQMAFALGSWLTPWDWLGQRAVALMADLLTIAALAALLRALRLPLTWLVVYLWNPLVLKEIANSAHIDALACAALAGSFAVLAWKPPVRARIPWCATVAGILLGASILTKLYPLAVLPLSAAACLRLAGPAAGVAHLCGVLAALAVGYAAFSGAGAGNLVETLGVYLTEWERNAGVRRIINWLSGSAPLTPSTSSWLTAVLVGLGLAMLIVYWIRRITMARRDRSCVQLLLQGSVAVFAGWLLTAPAVFPWYALPLITLSCVAPRFWVVCLSGAFGAYYLLFLAEFRTGSDAPLWKQLVVALEHGIIWLGLAWAWWNSRGARTAAFWRL